MCTLALAMDNNLSIYLVKIRTYLKIRNAIPHMLADRHIAWSVLVTPTVVPRVYKQGLRRLLWP